MSIVLKIWRLIRGLSPETRNAAVDTLAKIVDGNVQGAKRAAVEAARRSAFDAAMRRLIKK